VYERTSEDQQALEAQLSQSREKLAVLLQDLRGIDGALEELSSERQRYHLLQQVCGGLEELRGLGAARLFWGDTAAESHGDEHLRAARGRLDAFEKRLTEIEDKRHALLDEITLAEEDTELLEDDVFEEQRKAEQRKLEWVIEREVGEFPVRASVMPWARGGEDDRRFRKTLALALLLSLLFGLVFPLIDLPLPEPWQVDAVPERLTRLIREERPLPPPPPVLQERLPEKSEPELAEESAPTEPKPEPSKTAPAKGILAFREKFSELAESGPSARLGAQARIRSAGEAASGSAQRSLVATRAAASGGIDVAALSRDFGAAGGGGIERVEIGRATSSIGAGGGMERPSSDGPGLARTDEEIQIVFDRHKAALYRLYNRELRRDPTLRGQMVLRITIQPDGSVSLCELHSTDMKAPRLSQQVVARVETFDFGAKDDIPAITILYPIDFLPAT
jgi:hypothetical protein